MVVVFTSIFQIDKKTTNNNKRKTKRECDEFRKGDIVGSARARARERKRAKRVCRREAKLNKKREHTKERKRANREHARALYSLSWESESCASDRMLSLSHTLGKRTIGMRATERERAGVEDRRKSMRREGMLGFITITKQQTKNEKTEKQC